MMDSVSKRYFITLPDGIAKALEEWAAREDNKPTTLAAYLVEEAVRRAIDEGKTPPPWEISNPDQSQADKGSDA